MEPLVQVVREALALGLATPLETLQKLLLACGGEHCYRRERISYQLHRYVVNHTPLPMSESTTHRFKADFAKTKFLVHDPETRFITAQNLRDEDVATLRQYGGGHLIEELPKEETADLSKLTKAELQGLFKDKMGEAPADTLTKAELIDAIQKK